MVEFVHHDVIEVVRLEQGEVLVAAQGLDRGEEQVRVLVLAPRVVPADAGARAYPLKARLGLEQDLFPVGDEEDAPGL